MYPFRKRFLAGLRDDSRNFQASLDSAVDVLQLHLQLCQTRELKSTKELGTNIDGKVDGLQQTGQRINQQLESLASIGDNVSRLPGSLETVLVDRLEELGRRLEEQNAIRMSTPTQPTTQTQGISCEIAMCQLQMIRSPSLLHSVDQERRHLQSFGGSSRAFLSRPCQFTPRANAKRWSYPSKYAKTPRRAVLTSRNLEHHPLCPFRGRPFREIGFTFSHCGALIGQSISAFVSMTRGSGMVAINPSITINRVVSSSVPAFALLKQIGKGYSGIPKMVKAFEVALMKLSRFYAAGEAFPHDVNPRGDTVLQVC